MTETRIARYGNSLTVRLPAALARDLDLREGDLVTLRRAAGGLLLERPAQARLKARLASVKSQEAEIDSGPSLGAERLD